MGGRAFRENTHPYHKNAFDNLRCVYFGFVCGSIPISGKVTSPTLDQ